MSTRIRSLAPKLAAAAFLALATMAVARTPLGAQEVKEDLAVMARWPRYTGSPHAIYHHLTDVAIERLEQRAAEVAKLRTAEQWRARQREVRRVLEQEIIGPFPEKTPLNARVTGVVRKPGFRVEKIVYESVPGFYVTAAMFIPDAATGPTPTLVFCSGHTADAFRNPNENSYYQWMVLNLVRKGFIVFAFDPISQGERTQYYDAEKRVSRLGKASAQHGYTGPLAFVADYSLGRAMTWDGIRGLDYLETRPEVDMKRIGMFGNSGGGTHTAYIAAVDDRVYAAAPGNWFTSLARLLETRGPQDPEQYLYQQIARGIDHADLLLARAPKPTLLVTTTRDFFSIQGSRETFAEAKRAFAALGNEGNLEMSEADFEHGYPLGSRESTYAFFQKYLGLPGSPKDEPVQMLTPEELRVTTTGEVATSLGGETFFSLTRAAARPLVTRLERSRRDLAEHVEGVRSAAREISGYRAPKEKLTPIFAGRYNRDGYAVEKYMVKGEGGYPVPYLLMVPSGGGRHPAVLYLHPEGKAAQAAPGGEMERLVRKGYAVLAPDLVGTGEMRPESGVDAWEMAMLLGRSLAGIRAGDAVRLVEILRARPDVDASRITGVARGELGSELLHAAAFEPSLSAVALVEPLLSFRALLDEEYYARKFVDSAVAGALRAYDLPDLAASLAPRPLLIVNPTDGAGTRTDQEGMERDLAVTRAAYAAGAASRLTVQMLDRTATPTEALVRWLP